jgi:prolyl oligopeptidase
MSAYHHVQDGSRYPAVLLQVGRNDPRVEPWQSAKMAARLQAATTSGKPVLFSMDDDAGHGGPASTRNQRQGDMADAMAFALWQFGVPEFQPTATPVVVGASPR